MNPIAPDETLVPTYYDRPVLKRPVWIWTVPVYFYVGGAAGAALVLGASAQLMRSNELRAFITKSRWIGLIGATAGSLLLTADLGRPERFYNMLRTFNPRSPLSVGSWILAAAGSTAALSATTSGRIADVAGLAAGTLGIPLAGYTGVLLCNSAVPVWQHARRFLPALFVASAVASCASFFDMTPLSTAESRIIHRFAVIGKASELLAMSAVELELSRNVEHVRPLKTGIPGALWTASKVLTAASLVMTLIPGPSKTRRVAGMLGTLAGLGLRFAVFYAGFTSSRNPKAAL